MTLKEIFLFDSIYGKLEGVASLMTDPPPTKRNVEYGLGMTARKMVN